MFLLVRDDVWLGPKNKNIMTTERQKKNKMQM